MMYSDVVLNLPDWVRGSVEDSAGVFPTVEERMQFVIELSRQNIERKTGGPFGAGVFEADSGRLIAVGVNRVESTNCSIAHAEIMAIALAQKALASYDMGGEPDASYELVTSTEPCVMCLGDVCWSGVKTVVCGARDEDARRIGFDEGPKPQNWVGSLESRGIGVVQDVLREQAAAVLTEYRDRGGLIYNPGG